MSARAAPPAPDVTVLVPVRNEGAVLRETAPTILGQRFDGRVEFLFLEGRSTDATRAILDELTAGDDRVRVVDNPSGDLASALQIGLPLARGEFVAKMDAHTFFPPAYLQAGVDRLRRGDVAWVSGPPVPRPVGAWSRRVALALSTWLGVGGSVKWPRSFDGAGSDELALDTGVFSGVWRREVLTGLGGWDPGWPSNEDAELASRFLAAGERIVGLRDMAAEYVPRDSLRGLWRQYWGYGCYRIRTARRHHRSLRRSHVMPPTVTLALAAAVVAPRPVRTAARAATGAYAGALAVTAAQVARGGAPLGDAAALPAVLATMHVGYGAGMLAGARRFGVPWAAIAHLARLGRGGREGDLAGRGRAAAGGGDGAPAGAERAA
jgi:glycosyltransferase involved in cell wall biosynthesis